MFTRDLLKRCSCRSSEDNISKFPELKEILPIEYNYTVCEWEKINDQHFECRFRVNVTKKDAALSWLDAFQVSSKTSYTKLKTFREDTANNIYKVVMKCHQNTKPKDGKKSHAKHTNCPAKILITLKKTNFYKNYQTTDVHLPSFPLIVTYRNRHNHDLDCAGALKYYKLNSDVKDKFITYFKEGMTPAEAFNEYTDYLKLTYGNEFFKVLEDGSLYPKKQWAYQLYYRVFKQENGDFSKENMLQFLKEYVEKYNEKMQGIFSKFRQFDDGNFVVVVVSPLMKRVLEHFPETSQVLFSDSIGNDDSFESKVYLLLINSCFGGLPVGCIISSSEGEAILSTGLEIFKTFLNNNCFNGRALEGPKFIITDDCTAERNSFKIAFPNATLLLGTFHVLRAVWKFIMKPKNEIPLNKKQEMYFSIKEMVYCVTNEELSLKYNKFRNNSDANRFPQLLNYIDILYSKKEEWAKCLHQGQNTNNACEPAIKIFKESILKRLKAYSPKHLFDYILSAIDKFYKTKLFSIADACSPASFKTKLTVPESELQKLSLVKLTEDFYKILNKNANKAYLVDTELGLCSCPQGESGAICKHQVFISKTAHQHKFNPVLTDSFQKALLYFIATGQKNIPSEWLSSLCQQPSNEHHSILPDTEITISDNISISEAVTNTLDSIPIYKTQIIIDSFSISDEEINNSEETVKRSILLENFRECFKTIAKKSENNPEILTAVGNFLNNYNNLETDNSLISALNCFGKVNDCLAKSKAKKSLVTAKKNGVQSMAFAQHETFSGGLSANLSEKPPKRSCMEQHVFNQTPKSTLLPKKKIIAVPHVSYIIQ